MKICLPTVLVSTAFLMSGCDINQLTHSIGSTEPMLVISPATELQISDTETAHVVGDDKCPEQTKNWFMGVPSMNHLPNGCINITKDAQEVGVTMRTHEVDVVEVWKVNRHNDAISLIRPNGYNVREPSHK